jgi:hypothetical protein
VKLSGPGNYVSWARHAQLILSSHGYENLIVVDDEKNMSSDIGAISNSQNAPLPPKQPQKLIPVTLPLPNNVWNVIRPTLP